MADIPATMTQQGRKWKMGRVHWIVIIVLSFTFVRLIGPKQNYLITNDTSMEAVNRTTSVVDISNAAIAYSELISNISAKLGAVEMTSTTSGNEIKTNLEHETISNATEIAQLRNPKLVEQLVGDMGNQLSISKHNTNTLNATKIAQVHNATNVAPLGGEMGNQLSMIEHDTITSNATKIAKLHNATLVVQLGGEMGNQLQFIASAIAIKRMAKKHGINANIVLRHQDAGKWVGARTATQKCFIKTRDMDFEAANTKEFNLLKASQDKWLGTTNSTFMYITNSHEINEIEESLAFWKYLLDGAEPPVVELSNPSPVSLPFLHVQQYITNSLLDLHFDHIREFFQFDYERCCKLRADPDETVLVSKTLYNCHLLSIARCSNFIFLQHMRMFLKEMPKRGKGE